MVEKPQPHEEKDLWAAKDAGAAPELNGEFVDTVVARVHKRVIYKEFLFLLLLGFWNILLGFFKINPAPSTSPDQSKRQES
jgi:hypothetical protein